MINIKTSYEIELMSTAGNIVYQTHLLLQKHIKPGISTKQLEKIAEDFIHKNDAIPSFKGFDGFPASICTSINEEVVHGIPNNYILKKGDIISIDIGVCYKGYHSDSAWTYPVLEIDKDKTNLLKHTKEALYKGINEVKPNARIGDISDAIESYAKKHNLGIIKELVGHGVGKSLHEEPEVPNYGYKKTGQKLKEGMVIAIEPMLTLGKRYISILNDNWTIVTNDGLPAAHFEHTVLVTKDGYQILTGE